MECKFSRHQTMTTFYSIDMCVCVPVQCTLPFDFLIIFLALISCNRFGEHRERHSSNMVSVACIFFSYIFCFVSLQFINCILSHFEHMNAMLYKINVQWSIILYELFMWVYVMPYSESIDWPTILTSNEFTYAHHRYTYIYRLWFFDSSFLMSRFFTQA